MNMISKYICFYIFVISLSVNYVNATYPVCGNWQAYRDEKCFKVFNTEKFVKFEDAIESCSQIDNRSQILSIQSKEEQDFISEYLFKTLKLFDNVWIGLKNSSKSFEWIDYSNKQYSNWKTGYPSKKTDFNCVQLEPEMLQWMNVHCNKRGLVVCQKLPEKTLSDLLKTILETKDKTKKMEDDIIHTKEKLNKTEDDLKRTQNEFREIFNVVFNNKLSHYQLFTDLNGRNKAFIIPLMTMKKDYTFDDSVNLCETFNSTLIEIESLEKQIILESFLGRLGFESSRFMWFWINGERDSSGNWKWIKNKTQLTFTNWHSGNPQGISNYNNIFIGTSSTDTFGKWYNSPRNNGLFPMCEHTFAFSSLKYKKTMRQEIIIDN